MSKHHKGQRQSVNENGRNSPAGTGGYDNERESSGKSRMGNLADAHENASFHHESASFHHGQAAKHYKSGNSQTAGKHAEAADLHGRSAREHGEETRQQVSGQPRTISTGGQAWSRDRDQDRDDTSWSRGSQRSDRDLSDDDRGSRNERQGSGSDRGQSYAGRGGMRQDEDRDDRGGMDRDEDMNEQREPNDRRDEGTLRTGNRQMGQSQGSDQSSRGGQYGQSTREMNEDQDVPPGNEGMRESERNGKHSRV